MKTVGYILRQETPSLCDPMNAIQHLPITSSALPGRLPTTLDRAPRQFRYPRIHIVLAFELS